MNAKTSTTKSTSLDDDEVNDGAAALAATPSPVGNDTELSGKREVVTIHIGQDDAGSDAVFLGHNGYAYHVPRNQPVNLPTEVVQILRDATQTLYKYVGKALVENTVPRYSFSSQAA